LRDARKEVDEWGCGEEGGGEYRLFQTGRRTKSFTSKLVSAFYAHRLSAPPPPSRRPLPGYANIIHGENGVHRKKRNKEFTDTINEFLLFTLSRRPARRKYWDGVPNKPICAKKDFIRPFF